MVKDDNVFRQRDLPLLARWWRGYVLLWVLYAAFDLLRLAAEWSPINLDSLPDGVAKTICFVLALIILLSLLVVVAPLVLHYIAYRLIADPAIKSALANTTPRPSVLDQLPRISPEEEPAEG